MHPGIIVVHFAVDAFVSVLPAPFVVVKNIFNSAFWVAVAYEYLLNQWIVFFARSDWLLKLGIVSAIHLHFGE